MNDITWEWWQRNLPLNGMWLDIGTSIHSLVMEISTLANVGTSCLTNYTVASTKRALSGFQKTEAFEVKLIANI